MPVQRDGTLLLEVAQGFSLCLRGASGDASVLSLRLGAKQNLPLP